MSFDRDLVSISKYLTASAQLYRVVLKDIESTGTNNQTYRYLLVICKSKAYENLINTIIKIKLGKYSRKERSEHGSRRTLGTQ